MLSAGHGRRLLPMTVDIPKCLLDIHGKTVVEWQIDYLLDNGIDDITVVVGYGADLVEARLGAGYGQGRVKTLYNPFFDIADNLATLWMAREEMTGDFVLLNGDTLFESRILGSLLESHRRPITLACDIKPRYDSDDMKVSLEGHRLLRVGKDLEQGAVNGESIGMLLFRDQGADLFRGAVESAMRKPVALKQWYLSVIDGLAPGQQVWSHSIQGMQWQELDYPVDLDRALKVTADWIATKQKRLQAL
ncbi:MAG: phosphocholine cytidylyltransferase family protein [Gammaproteobacteria bacterium]|nr:phosphocholine cytidylyltransferase family protein [Gammaproteobacteria bacterium]